MTLLRALRPWIRVHLMRPDDEMPEHDLVWVSGVNGDGPGQAILGAIRANPELWEHAMPEGLCIVPRQTLERLIGADAAESLAMIGSGAVMRYAAHARYEAEERQRREQQ